MATEFMTEEEVDALIEKNLEAILSKVRCASSANESNASSPGFDPITGTTCGCCNV